MLLGNYERIFGKQLAVLFDRDKTSYDLQYFAEHLSGVPSASLSEGELLAMMNGEVVWGGEDVIELDFEDADLDN